MLKMHRRRITAWFLLLSLLFTGLALPVSGASVQEVYNTIISQPDRYPEIIQKLQVFKDQGVTDGEILAFLGDLDKEIRIWETVFETPVSEENLVGAITDALFLIAFMPNYEGKHVSIKQVVLRDFDSYLDAALSGQVPVELQPFVDIFVQAYFGVDETPVVPDPPLDPGPPPDPGPPTPPPDEPEAEKTPAPNGEFHRFAAMQLVRYILDPAKISQLAGEAIEIAFTGEREERRELDLGQAVWQALDAGQSIRADMGGVVLEFSAQLTDGPGEGETLRLAAGNLDAERAGTLQSKAVSARLKPLGDIFEFTLQRLAAGEEGTVTTTVTAFDRPVQVTFTLPADLTGVNLGLLQVYRLDETTGKWVHVGGRLGKDRQTVTAELNSFSIYGVFDYDKDFTDTGTHWGRNDIRVMAARQIAAGDPGGTFRPDDSITRAEFVAYVYRILRLPVPADPPLVFSDVAAGQWYKWTIDAIAAAGIDLGRPGGTFAPNTPITREEMAGIIVRARQYAGAVSTYDPSQSAAILGRFTDWQQVSPTELDYLAEAVQLNIIRGNSATTIGPGVRATRSQAIVIIMRLMESLDLL